MKQHGLIRDINQDPVQLNEKSNNPVERDAFYALAG
jgi:hypothetical protein